MSTNTRKPVTTYAHRQRRPRTAVADELISLPVPATSPLSEPDNEEISLYKMTRRLKKRSRQIGTSLPDLFDRDRHTKRSKHDMPSNGMENNNTASEQIPDSFFPTQNQSSIPHKPATIPNALIGSPNKNIQDSRSSGPLQGRTVFRRISAHDLKGNIPKSRHPSILASPFNSHPNSRSSSPSKSKTKRPRAMSHTLSANLAENRTPGLFSDFGTHTVSEVPKRKRLKTSHDSCKPVPFTLNQDTPGGWLGQPDFWSRSALLTQPDLSIQRPSLSLASLHPFVNDDPVAFSTPVPKRLLQPRELPVVTPVFPSPELSANSRSFGAPFNKISVGISADMSGQRIASESALPLHTERVRDGLFGNRIFMHDSLFSSTRESISSNANYASGVQDGRPSTSAMMFVESLANANHSESTETMSLTTILNPSTFEKLSPLAPAVLDAGNLLELRVAQTEDTLIPDAGVVERDDELSSSPDPLNLFLINLEDEKKLTTMLSQIDLDKDVRTVPAMRRSCSLPMDASERETKGTSHEGSGGIRHGGASGTNCSGWRSRARTVNQASYLADTKRMRGKNGNRAEVDSGFPLTRDDESEDGMLLTYDWV